MKKICILLILSLGTIAFAQSPSSVAPDASSDAVRPPPTTSTTAEPTTLSTTSAAPETSTTAAPTTSPTTAAPTTTPTTAAPTTTPTTAAPTTTPTTAAPTTSPTTAAPTTTPTTTPQTSTVPPTPSPSPKPSPTLPPVAPTPPLFPKNVGTWALKQGGESPCILLKGAFQLHVNRNNASDLIVDVPSKPDNVHISGKCSHQKQTLELKWWSLIDPRDNTTERNNTLHMEFSIQSDNSSYALELVRYQYNVETPIQVNGPFFPTNLNHSYLCKSNQRLENDKNPSYVLTQDLQFEAFRPTNVVTVEPQFNDADECKADNRKSTGVVLGIAVGVGLLIVVVISLGIYLYKRCRRGGYQPLDTYS